MPAPPDKQANNRDGFVAAVGLTPQRANELHGLTNQRQQAGRILPGINPAGHLLDHAFVVPAEIVSSERYAVGFYPRLLHAL